jgi:hypothetical protein
VRRGIAAFLVVVAVLAGAAFALDAWLTSTAERQAALRISDELGAPAMVRLEGWPVTLRLLSGRVPGAVVRVASLPLEGGATLQRLEARFTDVRIGFDDLTATGSGLPVTGEGFFTAEIESGEVGTLVGLPGAVRLGEGVLHVRFEGTEVAAIAAVEGGRVVIRPVDPDPRLGGLEVRLPPLPVGAVVTGVGVTPAALRLSGRVPSLAGVRPPA